MGVDDTAKLKIVYNSRVRENAALWWLNLVNPSTEDSYKEHLYRNPKINLDK